MPDSWNGSRGPAFLAILGLAITGSVPAGCGGDENAGADGGATDGGGQGGAGGAGGPAGGGFAPRPGGAFSGTYTLPGSPADIDAAFGGAATGPGAGDPQIVYPLDGAMVGRNIGGMNIQWRAGAGALFRVRVTGDAGEARFYAGGAAACPGGKCQLPVPDDLWATVGKANAGARLRIVVDGVASPAGAISTSAPVVVTFSPDPIEGGLHYWTTSLPGTMRVKLGEKTPEPFVGPGHPVNPTGCIGCHAVTEDGCRVAMTNYPDWSLSIVDAVKGTEVFMSPGAEKARYIAWNGAGTRLVTSNAGELTLRDRDGKPLSKLDRASVGAPGSDVVFHAEFAPDGNSIVFSRLTPPQVEYWDSTHAGDLMIAPVTGDAFGAPRALVPQAGDEYHYNPVFSPDSQWVVFNTGNRMGSRTSWQDQLGPFPADTNFNAYDNATARLRMVRADGSKPPVELANATHGMGVTASWPKFSPFVQAGSLMFIVFSAKTDYGVVLEQASVPDDGKHFGRPQLWVAAIDTVRGGDPSYAPFWLPFQLATENNHLGIWVRQIRGQTAGSSDCK